MATGGNVPDPNKPPSGSTTATTPVKPSKPAKPVPAKFSPKGKNK